MMVNINRLHSTSSRKTEVSIMTIIMTSNLASSPFYFTCISPHLYQIPVAYFRLSKQSILYNHNPNIPNLYVLVKKT
jgi:hypothetical protein